MDRALYDHPMLFVRRGQMVTVGEDPKVWIGSGYCTRGRSGRRYEETVHCLIDPDAPRNAHPLDRAIWAHHATLRFPDAGGGPDHSGPPPSAVPVSQQEPSDSTSGLVPENDGD